MLNTIRRVLGEKWRAPRAQFHLVEATVIIATIGLVFGCIAFLLSRLIGEPLTQAAGQARQYRRKAVADTEFPLGEFQFMRSTSRSSQTTKSDGRVQIVEFKAVVVTRASARELLRFETLVEAKKSRIRQLIDETARGASEQELNDPSLKIVRLRMKYRLNKLFGKRWIDEVIFSHYRLFTLPKVN